MALPRKLARFNRAVTNHVARPLAAFLPFLAVVVHTGRRTGRTYRTPVLAFPRGDGFVIVLTYSSRSDWVANVRAAAACRVVHVGRTIDLGAPELFQGASAEALFPRALRPLLRTLGVFEALVLHRADSTAPRPGGFEPPTNGLEVRRSIP